MTKSARFGSGRPVELPFEIRISRVLLVTIFVAALLGVASMVAGVTWLATGGSIVSAALSIVGGLLLLFISRTGLMRVPKQITIDEQGITWRGVALWTHRIAFTELSRVGVASNHGRNAVIGIPADGVVAARPAPPTWDKQAGVFTLLVLSSPGSRSPYNCRPEDVVAAVQQAAGRRWRS
jgi:hypothetical protein